MYVPHQKHVLFPTPSFSYPLTADCLTNGQPDDTLCVNPDLMGPALICCRERKVCDVYNPDVNAPSACGKTLSYVNVLTNPPQNKLPTCRYPGVAGHEGTLFR